MIVTLRSTHIHVGLRVLRLSQRGIVSRFRIEHIDRALSVVIDKVFRMRARALSVCVIPIEQGVEWNEL